MGVVKQEIVDDDRFAFSLDEPFVDIVSKFRVDDLGADFNGDYAFHRNNRTIGPYVVNELKFAVDFKIVFLVDQVEEVDGRMVLDVF